MKKIKFITSFILILMGFLITGESYQLYLDNFESANYNTTLFLNGSPHNTKEKMVQDITIAARQNQVIVFTVVSDVKSMLLSERRIYGTAGTEKCLNQKFQIYSGSFPSLLSGTKKITFHELEDLVQEDLANITQYYLIGKVDDIYRFKDSFNGIYAGNFPQKGYDSSGSLNIFLVWLIITIVMLFLSYYDVLLQKKESFIRISMGERASLIILRNVGLDTVVYSIIFIMIILALQNYTYPLFHLRISVGMFIIMLLCNALLYLHLYFYNLKEALAGITSSRKLLVLNYALKMITIAITLTVISSNIGVIIESIHFYQQRSFFKQHADYYYVNMAYGLTPDGNEHLNDEKFNDGFLINEIFYRKFFNEFHAIQLVTSGILGNNVILANKNSLTYLQDHIDELSNTPLNNDLYFVLPNHMQHDTEIIDKLKRSLEIIEQDRFEYNYDIIYYGGDPKIICIDENSLHGSYFVKSPIIVYNNIDQSHRVDSANSSAFRLDFSHDILYKLSPDRVAAFAAEHSLENHKLYYYLTNALEKYEYHWNIIKRTLYLNVILSVLLLLLEFVIIKTILRLEYEVNAIELSIKKILGYNLWQKNR